jgi:hypothetical protein
MTNEKEEGTICGDKSMTYSINCIKFFINFKNTKKMAIVKIFPEDQNRSDFSIRYIAEKYHVYEGDKLLRSNLLSIADGIKEVDSIVESRLKNKLSSVIVTHQGFEGEEKIVTPYKRRHTYTKLNCLHCGKEFNSIRSNHLVCSRECSTAQYNERKQKEQDLENSTNQRTLKVGEFKIISNGEWKSLKEQSTIEIPEDADSLKGFDELTRKSQSDKKRENYFKDLVSIIIGSRNYAGEMERVWDFDDFYKNLLRLNLVYYNNVNIFTIMPSIFKVEESGKFVPVSFDLWSDVRNQQLAVSKVLQTMNQMATYPTHQQQNALSTFAVVKVVFDDVVNLNYKVETLLNKIQSMNKTIKALEKSNQVETPPIEEVKKNKWFKF